MLDSVSALLEIGEKSPPAIDYFFMPPHPQWVPDVALKKAHLQKEFKLSVIGISNLSSKVLPPIRVKLPLAPRYEPVIDVSGVPIGAASAYSPDTQEVQIERLDPGEQVYIAVFLSGAEASQFSEPKVIVGDRLLSRGMRAVGFLKRNPRQSLFLGGMLALMLGMLFSAGHAVYEASALNPKTKALNEATAVFSGSGCVLASHEKAQVNETLLERHQLGEPILLQLNKVVSRKDLFSKDYVVICEAR